MSQERVYTTIEKADWGSGPWQDEPDKVQWVDEATGLDCLVVRGPSGALCGYVGVPNDHPYHGVGDYYDLPLDVHGGLTFADSCDEDAEEGRGICYVPFNGRPGDVWWLGFDCAHSWDITPGYAARSKTAGFQWPTFGDQTYKRLDYVRRECESLARQLKEAAA